MIWWSCAGWKEISNIILLLLLLLYCVLKRHLEKYLIYQ